MNRLVLILIIVLVSLAAGASSVPASYDGFNNAKWGIDPGAVKQAVNATTWQEDGAVAREFPRELAVTAFLSTGDIAGYKASTTYYFWNNRFFQATVKFNFDELKKYDFNYNVFRSVNQYYNAIRSRILLFTNDIFDLLRKKYGKQKPYFKGLDPRDSFTGLDSYLRQESWNLRYHPYDYYLHIVTQSYARWDFPKTIALFP
jgi:hypothetical protein